MKLPRDLSGEDLASLLARLGYKAIRQSGSHLRLLCTVRGTEHRVSIPAHRYLKVGTLSGVLADVAAYLEIPREELIRKLFG